MQTRELTIDEVRKVYRKHICRDFPSDERKPLSRIEDSIREGRYLCIGAWDVDGSFLAYAFFVLVGDASLLDYFAVVPDKRSEGIGTAFIQEAVRYSRAELTIIEIEDPEAASTEEERTERERRLRFYQNAGCVNTHVRVVTFGVGFLLLEYPVKTLHNENEIAEGYRAIYRAILPKSMFEKNIGIIE
ncbi:MAG: GNAT family N-acetyltransferase [Clostridiales bacterium]|nr:GNAT family N-acetyltransferase [Clostridiales bacterium]